MHTIRGKLRHLGMDINEDCHFCYKVEENIGHTFVTCVFAINFCRQLKITALLLLILIKTLSIGLNISGAIKVGI